MVVRGVGAVREEREGQERRCVVALRICDERDNRCGLGECGVKVLGVELLCEGPQVFHEGYDHVLVLVVRDNVCEVAPSKKWRLVMEHALFRARAHGSGD